MRLYLIREPRALVLSSDSGDYCLVFRRPPADSTGPSVVVELLPADDVALEAAVLLNGRVSGCLGVLRIAEGESCGRSMTMGAVSPEKVDKAS